MFYFRYLFLLFFLSFSAHAQLKDPEWPCVQVLVPEIVAAVVWPQVIDESLAGAWKQDKSLTDIVHRLSDMDDWGDSERQLIADFVESVSESSREMILNKLADGIIEQTNQRRAQYIDGIKRYTRQQISISKQIEATLNQLAELERQPQAQDESRLAEIEETLNWHQRIYDQREQAIISLCEMPVELEEKLSRALRELAAYLP